MMLHNLQKINLLANWTKNSAADSRPMNHVPHSSISSSVFAGGSMRESKICTGRSRDRARAEEGAVVHGKTIYHMDRFEVPNLKEFYLN